MAQEKKKKKRSPYKLASLVLSFGLVALILGLVLKRTSFPVLQTAGPIAAGEQQMLIKACLLMLIVVVPVLVLTFWFAIRYRESNTKATYKPDWDHNRFAEATWWAVPTLLIVALSIMTWKGTFEFDPYKPLASSEKTLKVQVVALDWRWLFIYPDHKVASINELHLPVGTPVQFDITSDAPMNSFWIPQLGGQMYAMPGMGTRLHLQADKIGEYRGSSANISGEGFSKMDFMTMATSQTDFDNWLSKANASPTLTHDKYHELAEQSMDEKVYTFGKVEHGLFGDIIGKYMGVDHHGEPLGEDHGDAESAEHHE